MTPQTISPETVKVLTQLPKELYAIIFLLSGGLALLIIREVFSFLKAIRKEKADKSVVVVPTNGGKIAVSPEEFRNHFFEAIRTDERLGVISENVKQLCACQSQQTVILDRISQTESRLETAISKLMERDG